MNERVRYVDLDLPFGDVHFPDAIVEVPDTDGWTAFYAEIHSSATAGNVMLRVWLRDVA